MKTIAEIQKYRRADGCWNCIYSSMHVFNNIIGTCSKKVFPAGVDGECVEHIICDHICNLHMPREFTNL